MKATDIIIARPDSDSKIAALKAFMKALKIKFETRLPDGQVSNEKEYDPEFVAEILQGDEDFKNGKGKKITLEELNSLWK